MWDHTSSISVGFMNEPVAAGAHICLVYRDDAERKRIVARFVDSGLLGSGRVYYFADAAEPGDVEAWLAEQDVDTTAFLERRDLTVDDAASTYCPDGTFVPERMLETVARAYDAAIEAGYAHARVTGEMSWALRAMPGAERLIEYEAAVNAVIARHPITAMCQYDATRFDGATIYGALKVHPYTVMHGQLVRNPYYSEEV